MRELDRNPGSSGASSSTSAPSGAVRRCAARAICAAESKREATATRSASVCARTPTAAANATIPPSPRYPANRGIAIHERRNSQSREPFMERLGVPTSSRTTRNPPDHHPRPDHHRQRPLRTSAQDPVAKGQEPQAPKVVRITDADLPKRVDYQTEQGLFEAVHEIAKAAALPLCATTSNFTYHLSV